MGLLSLWSYLATVLTLPASHEFCCLTHFLLLMVCVLKGRVIIAAKPGVKLQIPDGVVLEDEVNLEIILVLLEDSGFPLY